MKQFKIKVSPLDSGMRLDLYLLRFSREQGLGLSRNFIQGLIRNQQVVLEGKPLSAHYKIKPGEIFRLEVPEDKGSTITPEDIRLDICFEDEDLLVVNKPAGMVVHPAAGNFQGTLVNALLFHTKDLSMVNPHRPGIVHRLDKDTSGLIVVAKSNSSHIHLSRQFAEHSILRRYVALVKGRIELNEDVIELPIGRHPRQREKMSVSFDSKHRYAKTSYRVIKRAAQTSLVELSPFTGRTHQLRVHLSFIGHPILGDKKYGRDAKFSRLALHAFCLGFIHPRTDKLVEFKTPIPPEFLQAINPV
jgi:23S rRNA pseudouridine1911/1915/1917 synthase